MGVEVESSRPVEAKTAAPPSPVKESADSKLRHRTAVSDDVAAVSSDPTVSSLAEGATQEPVKRAASRKSEHEASLSMGQKSRKSEQEPEKKEEKRLLSPDRKVADKKIGEVYRTTDERPDLMQQGGNLRIQPSDNLFVKFQKAFAAQICLKYYQDLRTITITLTVWAIICTRWWMWSNNIPLANNIFLKLMLEVVYFVVASCFAWFCCTIVHNCVHVAIFKGYNLNTAWQVYLTLTTAHPVSTFIPGHNLSHHKYTQSAMDTMRTTRMRYKHNIMNFFMFAPSCAYEIIRSEMKYFKVAREQGNVKTFFRVQLEGAALYPLYILGFLYSPWQFVWVVGVPQWIGKFGLVTINLFQHDGCPMPSSGTKMGPDGKPVKGQFLQNALQDEKVFEEVDEQGRPVVKDSDNKVWDPEYQIARDFTGPMLNFFTCNNGYHTMHHWRPSMHWTKYPEASRKYIKPHQHPHLEQGNVLFYLWDTFIMSNRKQFDGKPYFPAGDDFAEDWVDDFFGIESNANEKLGNSWSTKNTSGFQVKGMNGDMLGRKLEGEEAFK